METVTTHLRNSCLFTLDLDKINRLLPKDLFNLCSNSDQKIVGNSLQPISVIIPGNLFTKVPC